MRLRLARPIQAANPCECAVQRRPVPGQQHHSAQALQWHNPEAARADGLHALANAGGRVAAENPGQFRRKIACGRVLKSHQHDRVASQRINIQRFNGGAGQINLIRRASHQHRVAASGYRADLIGGQGQFQRLGDLIRRDVSEREQRRPARPGGGDG